MEDALPYGTDPEARELKPRDPDARRSAHILIAYLGETLND